MSLGNVKSASASEVLFPPPDEPGLIYAGQVMHARLKPLSHRFTYRVFSTLLNIDLLHAADRQSALFSVNRRNLLSFFENDHIPAEDYDKNLRGYADRLLKDAGVERPSRILLLAYPRILGFVFNPISIYYCYDEENALTTLIYEVRNTFCERHTYVCKVVDGQLSKAGVRQERNKVFYVSPFIDMPMRYHFRMLPPGQTVKIRIFETDEIGDPLLSATFSGRRLSMNNKTIAIQLIRLPFMTLKVVAGIHWEALKLWLKGAKFHSRGKPPAPVSYTDNATRAAEQGLEGN